MSSLTAVVSRDGARLRIALSGAIDERADLARVFAEIDTDAELDLGGVDRLNSIGIRYWINHITDRARQHRVSILRASYVFVNQANCVANLFGDASIESCLAPYFCQHCSRNLTLEVRADEVHATSGVPPERSCQTCGSELEFDELDHYFRFLLVDPPRTAGTDGEMT